MYRSFLAYLYAVACNNFEMYKTHDAMEQTILPHKIPLDLNLEFIGDNEYLSDIGVKLQFDLVNCE